MFASGGNWTFLDYIFAPWLKICLTRNVGKVWKTVVKDLGVCIFLKRGWLLKKGESNPSAHSV